MPKGVPGLHLLPIWLVRRTCQFPLTTQSVKWQPKVPKGVPGLHLLLIWPKWLARRACQFPLATQSVKWQPKVPKGTLGLHLVQRDGNSFSFTAHTGPPLLFRHPGAEPVQDSPSSIVHMQALKFFSPRQAPMRRRSMCTAQPRIPQTYPLH